MVLEWTKEPSGKTIGTGIVALKGFAVSNRECFADDKQLVKIGAICKSG